ncbi:zinc finger protein 782 isoform X2 [Bicyclus anynana]|nr:zinc finger protein 782 isoform X2 [Bicyclus anynana]
MCMICLDSDSKLFLMSKHKLEDSYPKLTGLSLFQLCARTNLQGAVCVLCAQRLRNFRRLRDLSLRGRSVVMDLIQKYGLITVKHIKKLNHTTGKLKCNLVSKFFGPDHCDFHICHTYTESQESAVEKVTIKEENWNSVWIVENTEQEYNKQKDIYNNDYVYNDTNSIITVKLEPICDSNDTQNFIKSKNSNFTCIHCFERFEQENAYYEHMNTHLQLCVICLDTDSKLAAMSKHKLEEVYQLLTGQTLCVGRNLQGAVCVLCAQRLRNFRRLRDLCLRARSLMMDLLQKYDLISMQHINMIKQARKPFSGYLVCKKFAHDHCDLYIHQSDEDHCPILDMCVFEDTATIAKDEEIQNSTSSNKHSEVKEYIFTDVGKVVKDENSQNSTSTNKYSEVKEYIFTDVSKVVKDKDNQNGTSTNKHSELEENIFGNIATIVKDKESQNSTLIKKHPQLEEYIFGNIATIVKDKQSQNRMSTNKHSELEEHIFGNIATIVKDKESQNSTFIKKHSELKEYILDVAIVAKDEESQNGPSIDKSELEEYIDGNVATVDKDWDPLTFSDLMEVKKEYGNVDIVNQVDNVNEANKSHQEDNVNIMLEKEPLKEHNLGELPIKRRNTKPRTPKKNIHMSTNTEEKRFTCDICNVKSKSKYNLKRHIRRHSSNKLYSCEMCEYSSKRKDSLLSHKISHTGVKPHSCDICGVKFAHKCSLVRHNRIHTRDMPYCCDICYFKCGQRTNLIVHIRSHTGEKPYLCDLCDCKFAMKYSLARHKLTHNKEKETHSCNICDYKCEFKHQLIIHMRTHTGETVYSCDTCNYKCAFKSNLNSHRIVHTGEKPYSCKVCFYRCARRYRLKRHMKTHTGEKPFSCELCSYQCARRCNLRRHMKIHDIE